MFKFRMNHRGGGVADRFNIKVRMDAEKFTDRRMAGFKSLDRQRLDRKECALRKINRSEC